MTDPQWAPGHDNEAGYIDILVPALLSNIKFPIYVEAGDGSVHAKGSGFVEIEMRNVTFTQYVQMRETDLLFTSSTSDISKAITITLLAPDRSTYNNWNGTLVHRPGDDVEMDSGHTLYERVLWRVKNLVAT